jgi:hypothetical protein
LHAALLHQPADAEALAGLDTALRDVTGRDEEGHLVLECGHD